MTQTLEHDDDLAEMVAEAKELGALFLVIVSTTDENRFAVFSTIDIALKWIGDPNRYEAVEIMPIVTDEPGEFRVDELKPMSESLQ